jgi:hypothetical protein
MKGLRRVSISSRVVAQSDGHGKLRLTPRSESPYLEREAENLSMPMLRRVIGLA